MAHTGYHQRRIDIEELLALLKEETGEVFDLWMTMDAKPAIVITIKTGD